MQCKVSHTIENDMTVAKTQTQENETLQRNLTTSINLEETSLN